MFGFKAISVHKIVSAAGVARDYSSNLILSLTGESGYGTGNGLIFDRSVNAATVTKAGDAAQIVSSYSPFSSGWSYYFDGTGDYLTAPANTAYQLGAGDYTVEAWIYPTTVTGIFSSMIVGTHAFDGTGDYGWGFALNPTGKLQFWSYGTTSGTGISITETGTRVVNQWCHVAVSRSGTSVKLWVNGVEAASTTSSKDENYSRILKIGSQEATTLSPNIGNSQTTFKGSISNIRIVKGSAIYTSAFTPPTTALTAVANTSLLTCHSSRLVDDSSNAADISVNGNVTASTFAPFDKTVLSGTIGDNSIFFNGSSALVSLTAASTFSDFGTGDFTIECWAYRTGAGTGNRVIIGRGISSVGAINWVLRWASTGNLQLILNTSSNTPSTVHDYSYAFPLNTWVHLAVTRSGTTSKLFVDGTEVSSTTNSTNVNSAANTPVIGGDSVQGSYFQGFISNVRVVKGSAVYSGSFTRPTSALTAVSGTSLLTARSVIFEDLTSNVTVSSTNATISIFNPFGNGSGWSAFFDGTGDNISTPSNAAFTFGTGDLTLECWIFQTASSSGVYRVIFGDNVYGGSGGYTLYSYNNALNLWKGGSPAAQVIAPAGTIALNTWTHVAWTRSGGSNRLFINGTQVGSTTADSTNYTSTAIYVGSSAVNTLNFTGYISNARVVKGTAVYTSNFTPSTSPLTAISGTSLLTLQDSALKDNSSNAFTLTRVGDVAMRGVGPFTAAAATVFPGSVYFDGSNDYLTIPASAALNVFGGDFTIECWFNPISFNASNFNYLIMQDDGGNSNQNFQLTCTAAGLASFTTWNTSSRASSFGITSTRSVKLGAWNHIAVTHVKSTNTTRLFVNGRLEASSTTAIWAGSASVQTCLGNWSTGASAQTSTFGKLNGYMSGVRLIKGSALYTAAFTPPTSPPTATADTALLLNFNDGCMVDTYGSSGAFFTTNTGVVSNLAIKKSGTGSIYFPAKYMATPANPDFALGTGDFTIEFWLYSSITNNSKGLLTIASSIAGGSGVGSLGIAFNSSAPAALNFLISGATTAGSISISNANWTHVALCRSAGTVRLFVGGVLSTSAISSTNLTGQILTLGTTTSTTNPFTGYIDNLVIYKGYAKYTSGTTFTPV